MVNARTAIHWNLELLERCSKATMELIQGPVKVANANKNCVWMFEIWKAANISKRCAP
jgi:hypothetical protein